MRVAAAPLLLLVLAACGQPYECETPRGIRAEGLDCAALAALEDRVVREFAAVWPEDRIVQALPAVTIRVPDQVTDEGGRKGFALGGQRYYGATMGTEILVADPADENAIAHELAHALEWEIDGVRDSNAHAEWAAKGLLCAIDRVAPFPADVAPDCPRL